MNWSLFVTKKVVSGLLNPVNTSLLLVVVGVVWWRRRPQKKAGCLIVLLGCLYVLVSSLSVTSYGLISSVEALAGPPASSGDLSRQGVKFIVVLGGGIRAGNVNPAGVASCDSLERLVEALRLWRQIPGSKLILSGGAYSTKVVTTGEAMAQVARELGVPEDAMILETRSWDTQDEAALLKPLLGSRPFALVTSASHMHRSLLTFRRLGMKPVPAPADFYARQFVVDFESFIPASQYLLLTQKALHELLGTCWLLLKGSAAQ